MKKRVKSVLLVLIIVISILFIIPFIFSYQSCLALNKNKLNITDEEKIAVINRWHYDLYNTYEMKMLPCIITANMYDPVTKKILDNLRIDDVINHSHQLYRFRNWAYKNIAHTQGLDKFKKEIGKDPWGAANIGPIYKKLIASEMKAMHIYSNKQMTGKCSTIVNLIASMFRLLGVKSENIAVMRVKGHSFGLVKINSKIYFINNQNIMELNDKIVNYIVNNKYYGLYNDKLSIDEIFWLDRDILNSEGNIVDNIVNAKGWDLDKHIQIREDITKLNLKNKELLFNTKSFNNNKWLVLSKYACQYINVEDPEVYLKASIKGPVVNELSKKVDDIEDIFLWINDNIESESIFKYDNNRIMLADQVIVFKTGNTKDKGVLIFTLLSIKGYEPELIITENNSYIRYNNQLFDIKNQKEVKNIDNKEIINVLNIQNIKT